MMVKFKHKTSWIRGYKRELTKKRRKMIEKYVEVRPQTGLHRGIVSLVCLVFGPRKRLGDRKNVFWVIGLYDNFIHMFR